MSEPGLLGNMLGQSIAMTAPSKTLLFLLYFEYASPNRNNDIRGPVVKSPSVKIAKADPLPDIFVPEFANRMAIVAKFVFPDSSLDRDGLIKKDEREAFDAADSEVQLENR